MELQTAGRQPPLFLVHAAGGLAHEYVSLAQRLGPDQPFYGLQAQGLDGSVDRLATVEEMASLYIEEIRRVQPKGPYQLTGMCEGAHIAFEMVRMLSEAGDDIQMFCTLDAWPVDLRGW